MKKLAVFVEGQTEQIFAKKLIKEIAGAHNVAFTEEKYHAKQYLQLKTDPLGSEKFSVLIVDCGSDGSVLTSILERHGRMTATGYCRVIGLRDLFPEPKAKLASIQKRVDALLPVNSPPSSMVIAVMEVEAWFIQEFKHFNKIEKSITPAAIHTRLGHDCANDNAEDIAEPAKFLHRAYKIGRMEYRKKRGQVQTTVDALDYEDIYMVHGASMPSLGKFIQEVEAALF